MNVILGSTHSLAKPIESVHNSTKVFMQARTPIRNQKWQPLLVENTM